MSRVVFKRDADGGAHDFEYVSVDFVIPEHVGDPTKDLYETDRDGKVVEGPLDDDKVYSCHLESFWPVYAQVIMRRIRDAKLWDSDYMAYSDYPHVFTQAWKDHRQALRNVPQNNPSPNMNEQGELINVTWPEEPEWPANTSAM